MQTPHLRTMHMANDQRRLFVNLVWTTYAASITKNPQTHKQSYFV